MGGEWPQAAVELIAHIKDLEDEDIDEAQAILESEKANKKRKSVIEAAEERMAALEAYADPESHDPIEEAAPPEEA